MGSAASAGERRAGGPPSLVLWKCRGRPGHSFEPVLRLPVPPEVHLPLEALPTQVTAEGLEACVLAAVGDEVGALAEGLAAHLALVGLLTCRNRGGRGGSVSL